MTTTPNPPDRIVLKAVPASLCFGDENVVLDISELQREVYLGETLDTSVVKAYARSDGYQMDTNVVGTADLFGNTDWNMNEGVHDILLRVNASQSYGIRLYIDHIIRDRPEGGVNLQAQMIWPDAPLVGPYGLGDVLPPALGPSELTVTTRPSFGPTGIDAVASPSYGPFNLTGVSVPTYGPSNINLDVQLEPLLLADDGDYGVRWGDVENAESYNIHLYNREGDYSVDEGLVFNQQGTTLQPIDICNTSYGDVDSIDEEITPVHYWRVHPIINGVEDTNKIADFALINPRLVNKMRAVDEDDLVFDQPSNWRVFVRMPVVNRSVIDLNATTRMSARSRDRWSGSGNVWSAWTTEDDSFFGNTSEPMGPKNMRVSAYDNNNQFRGGSTTQGYIQNYSSYNSFLNSTYYKQVQFLNLHSWTSQNPEWKNNRNALPSASVDVYGSALRSQHFFSSDIPVNTCEVPPVGPLNISILSTNKRITFNSSSLGSISYMDENTQDIFNAEGVWNQVLGIREPSADESPKEIYEHSGRPGHFLRYYYLVGYHGPDSLVNNRNVYSYKFWGFCIGDPYEDPAYTSEGYHFQSPFVPGYSSQPIINYPYSNVIGHNITYSRETEDPTVHSLGIYTTGNTSEITVTTEVI